MVVIISTYTEPINPPSASPTITHAQFWEGIIHSLTNPHKFYATATASKVLTHTDEEIVVSQTLDQHETLGHHAGEHKNTFALSPPSKFDGTDPDVPNFHTVGIIAQGPGGDTDLYYTLIYEWNEKDTEKGSKEHEEKMKNNLHPKEVVRNCIDHTRKLVESGEL